VEFSRFSIKPCVVVISPLIWVFLWLAFLPCVSAAGPTTFLTTSFLARFSLKSCSVAISPLIWLIIWLSFVPCVLATGSTTTPFPDISFQAFSQFILTTFNSEISLETVLLVFFSLVENPDLLNLHARQKHPSLQNENRIIASSWMKSLSRG